MDKNLIFAFLLSFAVIFIYFNLFPPPDPKETKKPEEITKPNVSGPPQKTVIQSPAGSSGSNSTESSFQEDIPEKKVSVSTPLYEAVFKSTDAYAETFLLKDYNYSFEPKTPIYQKVWDFVMRVKTKEAVLDPDRKVNMVGDVDPLKSKPFHFLGNSEDINVPFATDQDLVLVRDEPRTLKFEGISSNGLKIDKTLTFSPDSYIIDVQVRVSNPTSSEKIVEPVFRLGAGNEPIENSYNTHSKEGMVLVDTSLEKIDADEDGSSFKDFEWAAVSSTYFIGGVIPEGGGWSANFRSVDSTLNRYPTLAPNLDLKKSGFALGPNQVFSETFKVYMGPKLKKELDKFSPNFEESLDLVFNFLARPMLFGLRWFHDWVGNWGIAIILLTFSVRILIFPLALKGMKSMKRMQKMTPKMQKLKEKYGKNKERMNKEMMQLYKRNKINPVGGCLPLLMQIPIFIALYWALLPALELRHQPFFLWIHDLSAMDHTLILPLLMGVTMFLQQQITPMSAAMDPMQQKIFKFFPLVMILFFITFPSGLVLYWVTSNTITIVQQFLFNKVKIKDVVD